MGPNDSSSEKNLNGDGTLPPPARVDDTNIGFDSSLRVLLPIGNPGNNPNPQQQPIPSPSQVKADHDPMATALFDAKAISNKQISFDTTNPQKPPEKGVSKKPPQKVLDQYRTITVGSVSSEPEIHIPGFQIKSELGRGAFGVVYRAYDEMLDRDVAIKVPLLNDSQLQKQYIDEARKAVKLEHPGIVQTYHVGVLESGQPFVIQKLIEGVTLRTLVKERGGALSLGEALEVLRPVCLALEAAHSIGLIHRDLKPENLLIDRSGRPFVADFGLAVTDDDELAGRTEFAGTPLYMSPEQFAGRTQWLDGRSDIWAIGVIFYEMLVGKPPFYANSIRELKEQVLEKDPRPIHQRQPNIPATFDSVFRKCCAKRPSDRFGSVRELIEALDNAIELLPEQEILSLMPEVQRGLQVKRTGSSHISTVGLSSKKRPSTTSGTTTDTTSSGINQSSWGQNVTTSSRIVHVWSMVGPLIAVLCTFCALGLMFFISNKNFGEPIVSHHSSVSETPAQAPPNIDNGISEAPSAKSAVAPEVIPPEPSPPEPSPPEPSPPESMDAAQPIIPPTTTPSVDPAAMDPKSLPPPVLEKPFRVSTRTGDGTHESLAAAIADSEPGDTIMILEGTYREPIIIEKNLKLVGVGDRQNVILQTEGKPCFVIRNNAVLHLEKLKLKTNQSDDEQANTLDVESGELQIKNCFVVSNSFDCVKLRGDSRLVAENSDFQSSEHATIRAETGSSMEINGCDFLLHPDSAESLKKVCIQAEGASGKISNSRFKGPCMAGIEWRDQSTGELTIEQCTFTEIRLAVSLTNCTDVVMRGDEQVPLKLKNCDDSIWIRNSTVSIAGAQITGNRNDLKKGIAAQKKSIVHVSDSLISGFATGIAVDHSTLTVVDTAVRDSVERNLWAQSSSVTLEDIELVGAGPNSLHVSGQKSSLTIAGGLISNTTSGIWIESGTAVLNQVLIRDCIVGAMAGLNTDMAKLFSAPSLDTNTPDDFEQDPSDEVDISGTGVTFSACQKGIVFMSPGKLAVSGAKDDFLADTKRRLSTRTADLLGVGDISNFKAKWKSIRERAAP